MPFALGTRSKERLKGVHPDLVRVVERAIQLTEVDFTVTEGLRTATRQQQLVAAGASKTMRSRHLTGHAVDLAALVGGEVRWDWTLYCKIAEAMRSASNDLKIPIRWGGTWKLLSTISGPITPKILSRSFPDGPHFELPTATYP
jgi:peptidoglycan L-alanyl-D-glutamate endopeptidase CwlK